VKNIFIPDNDGEQVPGVLGLVYGLALVGLVLSFVVVGLAFLDENYDGKQQLLTTALIPVSVINWWLARELHHGKLWALQATTALTIIALIVTPIIVSEFNISQGISIGTSIFLLSYIWIKHRNFFR
jgi:hypothetical protein